MSKTDKDTALIVRAQEFFKQAQDAENDNRLRAVEDIRFVDLDEQWDAATLKSRQDNGRPCMVINKCAAVVKQISNDARQNKPRIKVRPADDKADPELAELLNGLIRNIENASDADAAYDTGIDSAIKGGWGYWRVVTEYCDDDVFEQDIRIKRIVNPFSVYMDPAAKEADRSDAKGCIITEVMDKKAFEDAYPDVDTSGWNETGIGESAAEWFTENSVRVAEFYYKEPITRTLYQILTITEQGEDFDTVDAEDVEDSIVEQDGKRYVVTDAGAAEILKERTVQTHKVMWCKIAGNEIIEGPTEQAGKYIPVVVCIGDEAWIEGEPHLKSAFYHAKDAQRLYNWARSNAVETLALAPKQPYIGTEKMFDGHEKEWNSANSVPKMRLTANFDNGQLPQRQSHSVSDTGALQEAMQSSDDIKATTGLYDASMGKEAAAKSGKAILAMQRQGDTSTFHFPDNQARAIKFTGRILVDLIPKIYDTQRVVRLLNIDGSTSWSEINKRVPDPTAPEGYRVINDLSVGKWDVTCDVGPGYMSKRLEAADGMMQMVQVAPTAAPAILPRIFKNLDWPEADEIGQQLEKLMTPPQANPQAMQMQQQQMKMQQAQQQQEMQSTAAKLQFDMQSKQMDLQAKKIELQEQKMTAQVDLQKAQIELEGKSIDLKNKQIDLAIKMQELNANRHNEMKEEAENGSL